MKIKKNVHWVGALDYDIRRFDIILETQDGTTYNSYVVKGSEKTALIEIVKESFFEQHLEKVKEVTELDQIDYIIVNHTEPDHTGALYRHLELNPNLIVVGSQIALNYLKEIVNVPFNSMAVREGDTLSLGDKTLKFISVPMLHWPDTMYSYLVEDQILFTCDSFGSHFCDERIFASQITEDFLAQFEYYYTYIIKPYKQSVLTALAKIDKLEIATICTGHGPILDVDVQKYIELYRQWSTPVKLSKPRVVIGYVSAYGFTAKMAAVIAKGIKSVVDVDVSMYDLVEVDPTAVVREIEIASGVLLGSCTILADTLPPVWHILSSLNPVIHGNRLGAVFGSYGWSGDAVDNIEQRLKQLKFRLPVPSLKVNFNPSNTQLDLCELFGEEFAKHLKGFCAL